MFHDVVPGTDLQITAENETVRDVLIVHNAAAAANPALKTIHFGITAPGLTIKSDPSGTLFVTDTKNKMLFVSGTPLMWDSTTMPTSMAAKATVSTPTTVTDPAVSAPDGAKTAAMHMTLTRSDIAITPDPKALSDAHTVYPVYYDPPISMSLTNKFAEIRSGEPTSSFYSNGSNSNGDWVRAGWDSGTDNGTVIGAVRGMMSFDVYGPISTLNNSQSGQTLGNYIDEAGTNITSAMLTLTAQGAMNCPSVPPFDLYRTGPIDVHAVTWATDGKGSTGAFGTQAQFLGTRTPSGCGFGATVQIDDTQQVKDGLQNGYNGGEGTATIGIRVADPYESASYPYYWSWFHTETVSPGVGTASLKVTYTAAPYINGISTNPAPTKTDCGTRANPANPANAGYIRKNIGNQVTLSSSVFDLSGSEALQSRYEFEDATLGQAGDYFLPASGYYGDSQNTTTGTTSVGGGTAPLYSPTLYQHGGPTGQPNLQDGHTYLYAPYAQDTTDTTYLTTSVAGSTQQCYFTVAFTSPDPPQITAPDLPRLGSPSAPNMYAGMADSGFQITGTTGGVNIDHFDYVIDQDSAKVGDANGGSHVQVSSTDSNNPSGNTAHATIPVPAGVTTLGNNTIYVRAVDVAGNESPVAQYDFYLPGNPNKVATPGDVTGDGVPDILAVVPDPNSTTGAKHLVVFPGNKDPNILGSVNNSLEAAPSSAAPDGTSWANTLITHRGALRGIAVDDLFAFNTVTHTMSYYLNKSVFGQTANAEMFARSQRVNVTRPVCVPTAATRNCVGYAPDWSHVVGIVALGNAAGGKPGTFAGRTNLITIESDDDHGANVWMFSAAGGDQLTSPVLVAADADAKVFNWLNADLVAPGPTTASGLPDLWARDGNSGTLYQFTNKRNSDGSEAPTSLGNQATATIIGNKGQVLPSVYPTLVSPGSPTPPDSQGNFSEAGPPALGYLTSDGQLALVPGVSSSTLNTGSNWNESHTGWAANNNILSLNGASTGTPASGSAPASSTTGQILLGIDQASNDMCLDLPNANTNPGNPIQSFICNGTPAQLWNVETDGTIRWAGDPTKCIEIQSTYTNSNGTMAGSPVQINNCAPMANGDIAPNQRWIMRSSPGAAANNQTGWANVYNPASGKCLDNPYQRTTSQQMWIADCTDGGTTATANQAQEWQPPTAQSQSQSVEGSGLAQFTHEPASAPTSVVSNPAYFSNGAYTLAATQTGDHFGVDWYVPYTATFAIWAYMTTGPGNGQVELTVDQSAGSAPLPRTYETYSATTNSGPATFGDIALTAGMHSFTFTVIGKNAASSGYSIGLDTLFAGPDHGTGPHAKLTVPSTGVANVPLTANALAFPGGAAITGYSFDFGDGTPPVTGTPPGIAISVPHTYTAPGTYTVTTTATDASNVSATTTAQVTILSGPPIPNGDFEAGSLAGWTASDNAGVTTTNPHGGTYAGQINAPAGGTGSIEQVVNGLTPNTTYTLTGWIRTDGGTTHLGTKQFNTTGDDTGATTTNTSWTQLTNQFTTGPSNTSVDIYCYRSTAGTSACDDFSLAAVLATGKVTNGDFEAGNLSLGWSDSSNAGTTTANPHSGTYAGQINAPTGGTGSIEQVVNGLTPNTTYTLTGWVRTDGGATILGAKQYDPAGDNQDATTTATGWTQLSDLFTTGASNTSVDIYCYRSTAGTSACDDITLTPIPPATVANPDFETGNLVGWTASYNAGITTTNPHGGTYAGQINAPTGGTGSIEQVVNGLTPNTTYTLTGWILTDGGATILGTKQFNAAGDDTGATTTATGWTQLSKEFTTGATNTSVDIYCYRPTAGTSACDDFNLVAVPATGQVTNGDFETGNLAQGWSDSSNAGTTTSNPHGGTYAGQINAPTGGTGSIEQVVSGLTPNTSYTLTGWVSTDGSTTILGAKNYDAAGDKQEATTTATAWTQLTDQFTTGATNTSVDIYCYRPTAGTSADDDITLTKN
ncbi:carbohydrate binding domain-containing protein [Catenulispora rubra]|uniref:carbohydrate binding domain-containing protein n=1 Tax=Catenulispora rubra TaxID=280293 RepID=UPI001891F511|nr:carbohydrate binding domain-containing protein [Catenulispora rubra]